MLIDKKKSVVLIHGDFDKSLFDLLKKKKVKKVVVMEGRPGLESLRSSCRHLSRRKMTPIVIADNMAGFLFYKNLVKEVWVSYQVADKDGAFCNIGALILGVLGKKHRVPVRAYAAGKETNLMGKPRDLLYFNGKRVASNHASHMKVYVPLKEWVPKKYLKRIYG